MHSGGGRRPRHRKREGDIARALELGADDYIVKPSDPAEMRSAEGIANLNRQELEEIKCGLRGLCGSEFFSASLR